MTTTPVMVMGCTSDSINTAIWLASLARPVLFVAKANTVSDVLAHYKFDHQMSALWQMYVQSGVIELVDVEGWIQRLPKLKQSLPDVWLFLDAQDGLALDKIHAQFQYDTTLKLIISGTVGIGEVDKLANQFTSPTVYYVPFVFMKEGTGFMCMSSPDMVIVGEKTPNTYHEHDTLLALLRQTNNHHIHDIKTTEFARSGIMAMLATRVSFMNELARLADADGIDIHKIKTILGADERIGKAYLSAGWGFGGQTLPQDVQLLDFYFQQHQVASKLLPTVMAINEDQKELIFRKFWRYFDGFIENKTVMIWGAGYRSGTGRTTNSAIHPLLKLLWSYQITTEVYAPNAGAELRQYYGDEPLFRLVDEPYQLADKDALFVINWLSAVSPDVARLNEFGVPIFDAKNVFLDEDMGRLTGDYVGIGRNN